MEEKIKVIGKTDVKPFTIVKLENTEQKKEYYIMTCGNMRTEKEYENFEDAKADIENKSWELICLLMEQFMTFFNTENK